MSTKTRLGRQNQSMIAKSEGILLYRLARSLPEDVTPDKLTALGVLGAGMVFLGYAASGLSDLWIWIAQAGLVLNWFGDSLDGTVARMRKIERPNYGYYLDQTIDTVSSLLIALGLGLSPYFRLDAVLLTLVAYHMLSIHAFVRAVVTQEHNLAVSGFGTTELRIAILLTGFGVFVFGAEPFEVFGLAATWCDLLTLLATAIMLVLFGIAVSREAREQLLRDTDAKNR